MRTFPQALVDALTKPASKAVIVVKIDGPTPIYFSNGPVVGADVNIYRYLSGTMPGQEARFTEQKSNLELGVLQFDLDDKDGTATMLLNSLGDKESWYKREVTVYLMDELTSWANRENMGTYLCKEPPNYHLNLFYKVYCLDQFAVLKDKVKYEEQKFTVKEKFGARYTDDLKIIDVDVDDEYESATSQELFANADFEDWSGAALSNWNVTIVGSGSSPSSITLTNVWARKNRSKWQASIGAADVNLATLEVFTKTYTPPTLPSAPDPVTMAGWEAQPPLNIAAHAANGDLDFQFFIPYGDIDDVAVVCRFLDKDGNAGALSSIVAAGDTSTTVGHPSITNVVRGINSDVLTVTWAANTHLKSLKIGKGPYTGSETEPTHIKQTITIGEEQPDGTWVCDITSIEVDAPHAPSAVVTWWARLINDDDKPSAWRAKGMANDLEVTITATPTNLSVAFTSSPSGGTGPYTYDWNWGDGSAHGDTQNPTHVYATPGGYYTVLLTVTDSLGASGTASISFNAVVAPGGTSTPLWAVLFQQDITMAARFGGTSTPQTIVLGMEVVQPIFMTLGAVISQNMRWAVTIEQPMYFAARFGGTTTPQTIVLGMEVVQSIYFNAATNVNTNRWAVYLEQPFYMAARFGGVADPNTLYFECSIEQPIFMSANLDTSGPMNSGWEHPTSYDQAGGTANVWTNHANIYDDDVANPDTYAATSCAGGLGSRKLRLILPGSSTRIPTGKIPSGFAIRIDLDLGSEAVLEVYMIKWSTVTSDYKAVGQAQYVFTDAGGRTTVEIGGPTDKLGTTLSRDDVNGNDSTHKFGVRIKALNGGNNADTPKVYDLKMMSYYK